MRPGAVFIIALLTSVLVGEPPEARPGASLVRFPADVPPRNDIALDNRVPIPLRDGVRLFADVYRPAGDGRYPVLVSKTPYSTERFPTAYEAAVYFAQRGYVYVYADVRGRHESEGSWHPFFNSEKDGYDVIETIGDVAVEPAGSGDLVGHVAHRHCECGITSERQRSREHLVEDDPE